MTRFAVGTLSFLQRVILLSFWRQAHAGDVLRGQSKPAPMPRPTAGTEQRRHSARKTSERNRRKSPSIAIRSGRCIDLDKIKELHTTEKFAVLDDK